MTPNNPYSITPYDIYHIKTTANIGRHIEFVDEFCHNCNITGTQLYSILKNGQKTQIFHITYTINPEEAPIELAIDTTMVDLGFIFRRKWASDIFQVHCELFRKFSLPKIHDMHHEILASYWHIDNLPIWRDQLSHIWVF